MNCSESEELSLIQTAHFLYTLIIFLVSNQHALDNFSSSQKSPVSGPGPHCKGSMAEALSSKCFLHTQTLKFQVYLIRNWACFTSFFCRWFVVSPDLYPINTGGNKLNGTGAIINLIALFWLRLLAAVSVICFLVVIWDVLSNWKKVTIFGNWRTIPLRGRHLLLEQFLLLHLKL